MKHSTIHWVVRTLVFSLFTILIGLAALPEQVFRLFTDAGNWVVPLVFYSLMASTVLIPIFVLLTTIKNYKVESQRRSIAIDWIFVICWFAVFWLYTFGSLAKYTVF